MTGVLDILAAHRILPVVVVDGAARAVPLAETLGRSGLPTAEVTLRTPDAVAAISAMAAVPGFTVGAGTVLRPEQAARAVAAGARFVVSPGYSETVDRECRRLDVLYVPGVATATELQTVLAAGRDVVKLFPAGLLGGPLLVSALSAPFPNVRFVPTGGIGAADLHHYLGLPSVLAVGGTWLAPREVVDSDDLSPVEGATRVAAALVREFAGEPTGLRR